MEINNLVPNLIGNNVKQHSSRVDEPSANPARLEKIGKEFEGVFLSLLLKEMRNTLEEGGFFGGESSDSYGGLFDLYLGKNMAESSPLGIGEMIARQYAKNQT